MFMTITLYGFLMVFVLQQDVDYNGYVDDDEFLRNVFPDEFLGGKWVFLPKRRKTQPDVVNPYQSGGIKQITITLCNHKEMKRGTDDPRGQNIDAELEGATHRMHCFDL